MKTFDEAIQTFTAEIGNPEAEKRVNDSLRKYDTLKAEILANIFTSALIISFAQKFHNDIDSFSTGLFIIGVYVGIEMEKADA